jgi:hypothetical protein
MNSKIVPPLAVIAAAAALATAGCRTAADVVQEDITASLTGSQVVPRGGDGDGSGRFEMQFTNLPDNMCYELEISAIDPPDAAHIHRGARGRAGPPVVTLQAPDDNDSGGCITIDRALATEIETNPPNFYVQVHNRQYPGGALRGQLTR